MRFFQSLLQPPERNSVIVKMEAVSEQTLYPIRCKNSNSPWKSEKLYMDLGNCSEDIVSQKLYRDLMQIFRGHCTTKYLHGLYAIVPRTLYHKNYIWISSNCSEDALSQKLYMDFMQLFRGHCITKILQGLYANLPRALYHKIFTWTLCNCSENTISQKLYMDFM
jgi:hypothetical protein